MSSFRRAALSLGAALAAAIGSGAAVHAQTVCRAGVRELSMRSARTQLGELTAPTGGASNLMADGATCAGVSYDSSGVHRWRFGVRMIAPAAWLGYQGGVPDPRSPDGTWTGVGLNGFARAGVAFDYGMIHATLVPDFSFAQNRAFNFFPDTVHARSPFSSPWYPSPYSIDMPSRFGRASLLAAGVGQSALWISTHGADAGVSASTQSWGPGDFGQLLLGANAPGIPRIFVRTNHPISTKAGAWSGTAFVGTLTESPFFDHDYTNDLRTLIAWNMKWQPGGVAGSSTIGFASAYMRNGSPIGGRHHKVSAPVDMMNSFYAQVRAPDDRFRVWLEVARAGALPSWRHFLTVPYDGLAYLVGVERGFQLTQGTLLVTGEAADLEQLPAIDGEPTQDFYTSADVAQGWTQRGRVLGDGIGPGGQRQEVAVDWVTAEHSAGIFFERIRWNEDAFLRQYLAYYNRHDVTIHGGVRGGMLYHGNEINIEFSAGKRLNYLFQNSSYLPAGVNTVDLFVSQFRISIVPLTERRR